MLKKLLVLTIMISLTVSAFGQDLEETLSSLLENNASMYVQPLGDGMGALMNSGYYHRSKVHKMLGFDVGIKLMALTFDDDSKYFDFALPTGSLSFNLNDVTSAYGDLGSIDIPFEQVYLDANTTVPTVAGDDDEVGTVAVNDNNLISYIEGQLETKLTTQLGSPAAAQLAVAGLSNDINSAVGALPDIEIPGLGLSAMALPMPQLALGLPMGIELTVRGLPEQDLGDAGTFSLFGAGARLNIDQFIPIPLFPVDITAGAFYSQMALGEVFESNNTTVGLQVGKSLNLLIFGIGIYADAAYEMSDVTISYEPDPSAGIGTDPIEFTLETDPGLRVGGGLHLKLIPLTYINLHVSQTPSSMVATAGLGISFR